MFRSTVSPAIHRINLVEPMGDLTSSNNDVRVRELFDAVLDLHPDSRSTYLENTCAGDLKLLQEVESLLRAFQEAPDVLQALDDLGIGKTEDEDTDPYQLIGTTFRGYAVVEKLGGGGMGVVYKAHDEKLGRFVAIKLLPPHLISSPEAQQRFVQEARAASALDHAHIATVYDIGKTEDGLFYIVMAYYDGETLKQKIRRGPLPMETALNYAIQMARGLARAHQHGIIHRDVKPANVMVTEAGDVKIVDFGLAKVPDESMTRTGTIMGTAAYMSPEQARGEEVDHRTDLWSLGVVLYEMLTGTQPFRADRKEGVVYNILHEPYPPIRSLHPEILSKLAATVNKCLQKPPARRYASATALRADLKIARRILRPEAVPAPPSWQRYFFVGTTVVLLAALMLFAIPGLQRAALGWLGIGVLPQQIGLAVLPASSADSLQTATLTEALTRRLSARSTGQSTPFWVSPAHEVREFEVADRAKAHTTLGANLVLTVDVAEEADMHRIDLALIEAATGLPIRTETFTADPSDELALRRAAETLAAEMLDLEDVPVRHTIWGSTAPAHPDALLFHEEGLDYLQRSDLPADIGSAINLFQSALDLDSTFAPAYAGLADAHWKMYVATKEASRVQQAEQAAEQALRINERLIDARLAMGRIRAGLGKHGDALAGFIGVLDNGVESAEVYLNLAKAYDAANRVGDAEAAYKKAIDLKPGYWMVHSLLGSFYYRKARYEAAREKFERVIQIAPGNPRGYTNLGATFWKMGRMEEAAEYLEKAVSVAPSYWGYSNLATLYFYDKRYADAAQAYEQALAIQDTDYQVWGYMADAYRYAGHQAKSEAANRKAADLAERVLEAAPEDPVTLARLAAYRAQSNDRVEASRVLDRLIALQPEKPEILGRIAIAFELNGNRSQAVAWLERAIQAGYTVPNIQNHPGLIGLFQHEQVQTLLAKNNK